MTDEGTYRIVLLAGGMVVFPIAAWYRIRSRTGERLDRRQEGLALAIALRVLGLGHMVSLVLWLAYPPAVAAGALPLPPAARWAGAGLGALAGLLLVWTLRHLGPNLTDTVVTRERHTLVTDGPYRWVRHPFYVGFLLAACANSLLSANAFVGGCGLGAFVLIVLRTRKEEANLVARFGEEYRSFMVRTGRFLPRWPS